METMYDYLYVVIDDESNSMEEVFDFAQFKIISVQDSVLGKNMQTYHNE